MDEYKQAELVHSLNLIEKSVLNLDDYCDEEPSSIACEEFLLRALRLLQGSTDADLRKSYRIIREHLLQYKQTAVKFLMDNRFLELVQLIPGESDLHLEPFRVLYRIICGTPDDVLFDYCDEQFLARLWKICADDSFPLSRLHGTRCVAAIIRKCPPVVAKFEINVAEFICGMENEFVAYLDYHNCEPSVVGPAYKRALAERILDTMHGHLSEKSIYDWHDKFLCEISDKVIDADLLSVAVNFEMQVKVELDRELRVQYFTILRSMFQLDDFCPTHEMYTGVFRAIHSKQEPRVLVFALQCLCFSAMRDIDGTMEAFIETLNHTEIEKLALMDNENVRHELVLFFGIIVREKYTKVPLEVIIRCLSRVCLIDASESAKTTEIALGILNEMLAFDGVCEMIYGFGELSQLREMASRGRFAIREKACLVMCSVLEKMPLSEVWSFHQQSELLRPLADLLESDNERVIVAVLKTLGILANAARQAECESFTASLMCNLSIPRLQEIIEDTEELSAAVFELCEILGITLD